MKLKTLIGTLLFLTPIAVYAAESSPQNWGGVYIGAKAGYAWGDTDLRVLAADSSRYPDFSGGEQIKGNALNSGFAGAEIGYNFQRGNWVYGIFASTNLLNAKDAKWSKDACCGAGDDKFTTKLSNISIIGGRVGYAVDKILFYAGAGAAFGRVKVSAKDTNINYAGTPTTNSTGGGSDSRWLNGYALNMGADYALDDSWKLGLDYTYVGFKHKTFDASGESFNFAGTPKGKASYIFSSRGLDSHMLAATLKYTF